MPGHQRKQCAAITRDTRQATCSSESTRFPKLASTGQRTQLSQVGELNQLGVSFVKVDSATSIDFFQNSHRRADRQQLGDQTMTENEQLLALSLDAFEDPSRDMNSVIAEAIALVEAKSDWSFEEWKLWLDSLQAVAPKPSAEAASARLLEVVLEKLHLAMLGPRGFDSLPESITVEAWTRWYRELDPQLAIRGRLLTLMARRQDQAAILAIGAALIDSPLPHEREADLLFATFMQQRSPFLSQLFPALLDVAATPSFAASVLDLANFLSREKLVSLHPAHDRLPRFAELLGRLVVELEQIEQNPATSESVAQQQQTIWSTVPLAVALCDALALGDYRPSISKLVDAMNLGHRRLRSEAAWALARFGDERGAKELVMLAAEPVARRRILAYADELGIAEQIDAEYRTDQALAEADLALWLAEPNHMGLAPTEIQAIDSRWLAWPGYDDPIHCHLLRFAYDLGHGRYENIGFAGADPQAVTADLVDLSTVDSYALFAGLQSDHEEIQEFEVAHLSEGYAAEIARLERRMKDHGLDQIEPLRLGLFFGERVLAARAYRGGSRGIAVADSVELLWNASTGKRPLGIAECWAIYKGRKLLGAFNDGFVADEERSID